MKKTFRIGLFLIALTAVAWAVNVKISSFPDASTSMASADRVTGIQGGVNVNFSQTQIFASSGGLQSVSVSLSAAQIKALHTSPITLLAGVGGKTIIPVVGFFSYLFVSADFMLPGSTGIFYNATGNPNDIDIDGDNPIFDFSLLNEGNGSSFRTLAPAVIGRSYVIGAVSQNKSLVIYGESSNPATGGGSLTITVWYLLL